MNLDEVNSDSSISLAFTESPMFISPYTSDDSSYPSANMSYDGVLLVSAPLETGLWTQPPQRLRGGFRYLTVASTSTSNITISNVSCAISFMPHYENMRNYSGYFYASDPTYFDEDFLTKVGTNVLCIARPRLTTPLDMVFWRIYGTNRHCPVEHRQNGAFRLFPRFVNTVLYRILLS